MAENGEIEVGDVVGAATGAEKKAEEQVSLQDFYDTIMGELGELKRFMKNEMEEFGKHIKSEIRELCDAIRSPRRKGELEKGELEKGELDKGELEKGELEEELGGAATEQVEQPEEVIVLGTVGVESDSEQSASSIVVFSERERLRESNKFKRVQEVNYPYACGKLHQSSAIIIVAVKSYSDRDSFKFYCDQLSGVLGKVRVREGSSRTRKIGLGSEGTKNKDEDERSAGGSAQVVSKGLLGAFVSTMFRGGGNQNVTILG